MSEDAVLGLRKLVDECMIAVELGRHEEVSRHSSSISKRLVEVYDKEILEEEFSRTTDDSKATRKLLKEKLLDYVCKKLRQISDIALTYSQVVEFVRLRDLICLSQLVGAVPNGKKNADCLDYHNLKCVLRKSIYLLKTINKETTRHGNSTMATAELWWIRKKIIRTISTGFPIYETNMKTSFENIGIDYQQFKSLSAQLKDSIQEENSKEEVGGSVIEVVLKAQWFKEFLENHLEKSYPLERFIILIAIWIVGAECAHKQVERLMSELVDQIYHQETNSCNEEELLQLTQVGSFWLSYHKRHLATTRHQADLVTELDEADIEEETDDEDEDDEDRSSNDSNFESSAVELSSGSSGELAIPAPANSSGGRWWTTTRDDEPLRDHLRLKLRRIVDDELLLGIECFMCGHQPIELLGPLNLDSSCSNCQWDLTLAPLRCALSHRPLELFSLETLVGNLEKLPIPNLWLFVTPNEWVRQLVGLKLAARKKRLAEISSLEKATDRQAMIGERVDISENFERLTVIRRSSANNREVLTLDEDDHDSSNDAHENPPSFHSSLGCQGEQVNELYLKDYSTVLGAFMRQRIKEVTTKQKSLSESLSMLRFLRRRPGGATVAPVYLADFLVLDSLDDFIRIYMVASNELLEAGRIWSCSARSQVSRLMFGCGRLFSALELVRSGQSTGANEPKCPCCECHLAEVRCLYETEFGFT